MKTNRRLKKSLSEFKEEHPLSNELPYWELADDMMILADGTFVKAFKVSGIAVEDKENAYLNHLTDNLRAFLNGLPDSWEFSFIFDNNSKLDGLIDTHQSLSKDAKSQIKWICDNRCKSLKEQVKKNHILKSDIYFIIYRRFQNVDKKKNSIFNLLKSSPKDFKEITKKEHLKIVNEVNQLSNSLTAQLDSFGMNLKKLNDHEIIDIIYKFLNPSRSKNLKAPKINKEYQSQEFLPSELKIEPELSLPSLREQLCFSDLISSYDTIFYDGYFHQIITLKTLPEFTYSGLISKLLDTSIPFTLNVHFKVPEQSKELSSLKTKRRMAHSMSQSIDGKAIDLESEAKLNSTEELLREIISSGQKIFYFQVSLILKSQSKSQLNSLTNIMLRKFNELNSSEALLENIASFKLWKNNLPLGNTNMVRAKRVKCNNLADFLPIYEPYTGKNVKPLCLFKNRSDTLVSYDPYHGDLINYNTLVTGSSGSGKSFLNNLILSQFMALNPLLFVIDIGGSYKKLCEFFNGQYIEVKPPSKNEASISINPFHLENKKEPSAQKIKFLLTFLESILCEKSLSKIEKSLLEEHLIKTYRDYLKHNRVPTLSDLRKNLEVSKNQILVNFAKILFPWTGDRPYGLIFDKQNSFNLNSDCIFWDLKFLSNYPDLQAAFTLSITDFILNKVESKKYKDRKKRILMDECWDLLKNGGEATVNFMEYCVRTLRKTGSGITFITQGLSEIVKSPIGEAILSNTDSKFILKQSGNLDEVKSTLKLSDKDIFLISSLRQKKGEFSEAFMINGDNKSVIRLEPHPLEYWLATSSSDDNNEFNKLRLNNLNKPIEDLLYELSNKYPKGVM